MYILWKVPIFVKIIIYDYNRLTRIWIMINTEHGFGLRAHNLTALFDKTNKVSTLSLICWIVGLWFLVS